MENKTDFHSMEDSLFQYLGIKIHHLIESKRFDRIVIQGNYDRDYFPSLKEKTDKMFNWKRPTAMIDGNDLIINCFPGFDYVLHYALIKYYYYYINNKEIPKIIIRFPNRDKLQDKILFKDLWNLKDCDLVVLGYVDKLVEDFPPWEGSGDFLWKKFNISGKNVAIVGCKFSYWGDIAGRVVKYLAENGNRQVVYIGKLGSLNKNHVPNESLATGNQSYVSGEMIQWENPFEGYSSDILKKGRHYSSPSILLETKKWLNDNQDKYDFVDPEIGHMAKSANKCGISFGYIHIISNNLNKDYKEDLSNERNINVIRKRTILMGEIKKALLYLLKND